MMRLIRRAWSALSQPGTGGLIQSGDWRCRYPDGGVTHWVSYGDAKNFKVMWGGELEWRGDLPECEHLRVRETRACDAICRDCGNNLGFIQEWRDTIGKRPDSHEISN